MKIQSLSDKLFSIGGVSYPKGDFVPEYKNINYTDGVADQSQSDPVVNLINKATGVPMFNASLKWNQFKNSVGDFYANFNALQYEIASITSSNVVSIGASAKTRGIVYGDATTTPVPLTYDINVLQTVDNSLFILPNTTIVGKEVIVDSGISGTATIHAAGGNFETIVSGTVGLHYVVYNDLVKYTSIGDNNWIVEQLQRKSPTLSGKNLSDRTYYLSFVNNTTSELSLATLNSTYPDNVQLIGLNVFCPSITGGGLVYTKTGVATWVSLPITVVT